MFCYYSNESMSNFFCKRSIKDLFRHRSLRFIAFYIDELAYYLSDCKRNFRLFVIWINLTYPLSCYPDFMNFDSISLDKFSICYLETF